jgi:hypothetical protein
MRFIALAAALVISTSATAGEPDQGERLPWLERQSQGSAPRQTAARRNDAYRPPQESPGLGTLGSNPSYSRPPAYGTPPPTYGTPAGTDDDIPEGANTPAGQPRYPQPHYGQAPYGQPYGGQPPPYGGEPRAHGRSDDAYRPPYQGPANTGPYAANSGFGQPYNPPPQDYRDDGRYGASARPPYRDDRYGDHRGDGTYSSNEILAAGHSFFGSVSKGLASAVEYVFQRQGRPNGYILGEDAGGAFIAGLRYGEGALYTKDAGTHRVFWQGPSLGYDAGAEGSKVMVLVYNLRDPSEIYDRFPGVSGSAYVIGGVSLNFQAKDHIVLAPIRSGLGLRLGANIGYLKYTPTPTWNPF